MAVETRTQDLIGSESRTRETDMIPTWQYRGWRGLAAALALLTGTGVCLAAEAQRRHGGGGGAAGLPDFVIAAVSLTPPAPASGQNVYLTLTVLNRGAVAGDAGIVGICGQRPAARAGTAPAAARAAVGILAAGERRSLVIGPIVAPTQRGTCTLRLAADLNRATRESNELNNQTVKRYRVRNPAPTTLTFTGTVTYVDLEGGFFAITADSGENYDPINLPADCAIDGLRVWVSAQVGADQASIHMYGTRIRVLEIRPSPATLTFTGTVTYVDLEGGFFALAADSGENYDPINLPADCAIDGLRVWVSAEACADQASIHMYGTLIRVLEIRPLTPGTSLRDRFPPVR
jgi:hypothetical protein